MKLKSKEKNHRFSVMIPTKGRPDRIQKGFKKMAFLNDDHVYVGIEHKEFNDYKEFINENSKVNYVFYHNPEGSVSFARQQLKCSADLSSDVSEYIFTDDNAEFTESSLYILMNAHRDYTIDRNPCVMAGAHSTSPHFDRHRRELMETHRNTRSYPQPAMIFYCVSKELCKDYIFPHDTFGLDDRHFFLWLMSKGVRDFRVCPDAPFKKSRYQKGGQGTIEERMSKCGRAIEKIARDFPEWAGSSGTLRLPWQLILDTLSGKTPDRLAGGAMRSETKLTEVE